MGTLKILKRVLKRLYVYTMLFACVSYGKAFRVVFWHNIKHRRCSTLIVFFLLSTLEGKQTC